MTERATDAMRHLAAPAAQGESRRSAPPDAAQPAGAIGSAVEDRLFGGTEVGPVYLWIGPAPGSSLPPG